MFSTLIWGNMIKTSVDLVENNEGQEPQKNKVKLHNITYAISKYPHLDPSVQWLSPYSQYSTSINLWKHSATVIPLGNTIYIGIKLL